MGKVNGYTFFYYCFYREESWYQKNVIRIALWDHTYVHSVTAVTGAQWFNLLTLATVAGYYFHFRINLSYKLCMVITAFVLLFINSILFTEKKFKSLKSRYKNEKHKTLKGYGVLLYEIGSFVLWIICLFVFRAN